MWMYSTYSVFARDSEISLMGSLFPIFERKSNNLTIGLFQSVNNMVKTSLKTNLLFE